MILENPRHEAFCQHYVAGKSASDAYVAAGYSANGARQTAHALLKKKAIQARVKEIKASVVEKLEKHTIRDLNTRLADYDDIRARIICTVLARGADPTMKKVPGGAAGFMVRTGVREVSGIQIVKGKDGKPTTQTVSSLVEIFQVDTGLMRAWLEVDKQAAQEMGQFLERTEVVASADLIAKLNAARKRWKGDSNST